MEAAMKKHLLICAAAAGVLLLTGCASATTITEKEGNYIYSEGEDISIVDIDTRDTIGTLNMTGAIVLKDEATSVLERDGTDENGEAVYKETVYEQVVQIFYTYENRGGNSVSSANFSVYDAQGRSGARDPDIDVKPASRSGQRSFVVALDNRSDSIDIWFRYNILQTTATAKIRLTLSGAAANPTQSATRRQTTITKGNTSASSPTTTTRVSATDMPEQTSRSFATTTAACEFLRQKQAPMHLYGIIAVLSAAVVILAMALIAVVAFLGRRQNR